MFGNNKNYEDTRYGSAHWATSEQVRRAGLYDVDPQARHIGWHEGRIVRAGGMAGMVICAGARGGKLRDVLQWYLCGQSTQSMAMLDPKLEGGAVSQFQGHLGKAKIYFNPMGLHDLPQARINPLFLLNTENKRLFTHCRMIADTHFPPSGGGNAVFFETSAATIACEIIFKGQTLRFGSCSYGRVLDAINAIAGAPEDWDEFAFEMKELGVPTITAAIERVEVMRNSSGSGGAGVLAQLYNGFDFLADPLWMQAVSPPFTYDLATFNTGPIGDDLHLGVPLELIGPWGPGIKTILTSLMIAKYERPDAGTLNLVIDEAGGLGAWPFLVQTYTAGAGQGVRPYALFQSVTQMENLARGGMHQLLSSACPQVFFAMRDLETASVASRLAGEMTLKASNNPRKAEMRRAKDQAIRSMLKGEATIRDTALGLRHFDAMRDLDDGQRRNLLNPDEAIGLPEDQFLAFFPGLLTQGIRGQRRPAYKSSEMAGRFSPNPYVSGYDPDRMKVANRAGRMVTKKILTREVPAVLAHLPQYADGSWRYVDGYRPHLPARRIVTAGAD